MGAPTQPVTVLARPRSRPRRRAWVLGALALAAAAGLAALFEAIGAKADVLASGQLLDYTQADVSKVRVLGSNLYVERAADPSWDLINGTLLAVTASVALFSAALMRAGGESPRRVRLFALIFAGTSWLALDEVFGLHETIYYNLDQIGVSHSLSVDDALLAGYAVTALLVAYRYRDLIMLVPAAMRLMAAAAALGVVVLGLDFIGSFSFEEALELPVGLLALAAVWKLAAAFVAAAMRQPGAAGLAVRE